MGQKVNPVGLRVGINRSWASNWFAPKRSVPALVKEDYDIREVIYSYYNTLKSDSDGKESKSKDIFIPLPEIQIERSLVFIKDEGNKETSTKSRITITIMTANVGVVYKQKDALIAKLEKLTGKKIQFNVLKMESQDQYTNALIVAKQIASQLSNRGSFRKVQKDAIRKVMEKGNAKGVKTQVSGRLNGAEIARSEGYAEGRIPLHTLKADIDYATVPAHTSYGILGVKVWIYNGDLRNGEFRDEILKGKLEENKKRLAFTNAQKYGNSNSKPNSDQKVAPKNENRTIHNPHKPSPKKEN